MKWYIPSWNGDLRLVTDDGDASRTVLHIEKPTVREQQIVNQIGEECVRLGWLDKWDKLVPRTGWFAKKKWRFVINAPILSVGPLAANIMRPGPAVLTAIHFTDGQCTITSGGTDELVEALHPYRSPPALPAAPPSPPQPAALTLPAPAPQPEAAVTVKRPTPCCPQCIPGAILPASEVLLSFLDHDQHEQWARSRTLTVIGGLSGHKYLLAHRNTDTARRNGKVCYDLTGGGVMHFHDWSVPPEEEVLASMLILRHREHWLRNEATCFDPTGMRFKNPFGDGGDGIWDSCKTREVGEHLQQMMRRKR